MKTYSLTEKIQQNTSRLIILFSFIALIPIIWISFYAHPSADDYNFSELYTGNAAQNGDGIFAVLIAACKTAVFYYNNWQGCFSCSFLNSLQPGIWGDSEQYYFLSTAFLCLFIFFGIYVFLKELFYTAMWDTKYIFSISLITFMTVIEGFPSPNQGLFWHTGAMAYLPFAMLLLIQAALCLSFHRSSNMRIGKVLLGIVNAFILSGGNQITSFLGILVSLGYVVFILIRKSWNQLYAYVLWTLTSIVTFIFVMVAPGTSNRAASMNSMPVFKTIILSVINSTVDFARYASSYILLLLLLLFILTHKKLVHDKNLHFFKFRYLIVMIILAFGLYCASMCVTLYAGGYSGEGRVHDLRFELIILLYVCIFLYFNACVSAYIYQHEGLLTACNNLKLAVKNCFSASQICATITLCSCIAVLWILCFSTRVSVSYSSTVELLSGEAQAYDAERDQCIGMDLNDPVNTPDMIYNPTVSQ